MDYSMYYVPAGNVLGILVTFILCFALPVGLCIIWKIRTKANLAPVFVGAATFFVAALVLEQLARSVITLFAGTYLQTHLWAAAVFGGLMAGLFEETGRFVAMKWILKKQLNKENAIMYGIGHGGIEAMLITGMTYFSNIVLVILINTGNMALLFTGLDEPTRELVFNQLKALWELQPSAFLLAGVERISAILLHISLSYLVYLAVKKRKGIFYILAVLIHIAVDAGIVFLNSMVSIGGLEMVLLVVVAVLTIAISCAYRKEADNVHGTIDNVHGTIDNVHGNTDNGQSECENIK